MWISLDDERPEHRQQVMIWNIRSERHTIAKYLQPIRGNTSGAFSNMYEYISVGDGGVTHWMPLPDPPITRDLPPEEATTS